MGDVLDLPDDCWQTPRPTSSPYPGDLYEGVPLPSLEDFQIFVDPDEKQFWTPMRFSFAIVMRSGTGFVTLAPVTTGGDVADPEQFAWIVDQGRTAPDFARLPELPAAWQGDALALLIQPHTLPVAELSQPPPRPVATMHSAAQETFRHRVANAWSA
jgi:hypothetical protein